MNIVFMGTPQFSVPIVKALHETYGIKLIVTQPDTPQGRKRVLTAPPVKEVGLKLGIDIFQPSRIRKDYHRILDAAPDVIITAAYGQIIPKILLETPPFKALNVHASLLPKLRGGAPIQRAIQQHHTTTGVTIMRMSEKMDAGDILTQKAVDIAADETGTSLFEKLSVVARDLLLETLPSVFDNTLKPRPQLLSEVSYAPNINRLEERLDFSVSVKDLEAKIRAFYQTPNTYTTIDQQKLKVIKAKIHHCEQFNKNHEHEVDGTIIKHFDDGIGVKCSDGVLVLTEVQLAGKKAMSAKQFMLGSGKKLLAVKRKLDS